jgi:LPS O-antigen subunit length determinant protein (WzzB/FepE family)
MKKDFSKNRDEIDLIELLNTTYKEKAKVFLIIFISILIGIIINNQKPISIKSSLIIKKSKDTEFTKFLPVFNVAYEDLGNPLKERLIEPNNKKLKVMAKPIEISEIILLRFIDEILDYEELIIILSNIKRIKEQISGLDSDEQEQVLFNYSQSLSIYQPKNDKSSYNLSLEWNNIDESRYILNSLLKLVNKNLETRIFKELDDLVIIKQQKIITENLDRIRYLTEQSELAKELDIKHNQLDSVNLSQSNGSFNINTDNVAYYLRGFKTIDKEIEIIKARELPGINKIKKDINFLKQSKIKWADYNINYLQISSQNKTKLNLLISIGVGFIISMLYVFIIHAIRYREVLK